MISVWSRLWDLLSPRQCAVCNARLSAGEHTLCAKCSLHLPRTLYQDTPEDNEMARMFWGRLPIKKCAALFFFNAGSESSNIVYKFKYHHHPEIALNMGEMMGLEFQKTTFFEDIDLIIAVPLAKNRQRQRGYNQSELIAAGIHNITCLPIAKGIVRRKDFKESQTQKDRWQRNENVENAFELVNSEPIKGKHVLLIDDVATTGATLCACGKELLKAEGLKLSLLTLSFAKS
ncbi:MAG: ComF family protein [Prevotella sp.]|jgi:ComF family protein|nr:ComF family protein [Prevotella sp.]MCI1282573.1 ComF family protein [Prevotella sp.]